MRRKRVLSTMTIATLCWSLASCALGQVASWPMFRHNSLHTGRSAYAGPASGVQSWTRSIGLPMGSSPAVVMGRVYAVGGGRLHCFDKFGNELWSFQCNNSGASSPAVASDGTAYVASTDGNIYAIGPDGVLKWRRTLLAASESSPGLASDGTVYVGTSMGKLYAFKRDGTQKFVYAAGGAVDSSPAVASDGTIYFVCDDGKLYAIKPDGSLKWKFAVNPVAMVKSSPSIASDGTVYFGTMAGTLYALWPDGRQRWRYMAGGGLFSSPATGSDGSVYIGSRDGNLYCVSKLGVLIWRFKTGGYVDSSPAVDSNGIIYFGSTDASMYAVEPEGTLLWSRQIGGITSSPAIGESDTLYISTAAGELCCFGVDTTPPPVPIVADDGAYTASPTSLHAAWSCVDPESGITKFEYAIGTAPGAWDVVPFTDVGTAPEVTATGLALANGAAYYFSVRATNGAGLTSPVGTSDGIWVDATSPATPVVIDDGEFTSATESLHVAFSSGDTESGIAGYEYSIGTAPGLWDILAWQDSGLIKDRIITGLTLAQNGLYYVNVRARNHAGLTSEGHSNGIRIDTTPPSISSIVANASGGEIRADVAASDPESGIGKLQYVLLNSPDLPPTPDWVSATPGQSIIIPGPFDWNRAYYVAARVANRAGLWSDAKVSDAVRHDTTPPTTPTVTDDGVYWHDATTLHASWTSQDPDTGIKGYSYCVGNAPGGSDVVEWTETTETSVTLTNLNLTNGGTYYFSVRATNQVGLVSVAGNSDGITIDNTPPSGPIVLDDGDYTQLPDTLHATWSAMDQQSGIAEYFYCIGSAPGQEDLIHWTSSGPQGFVTVTGLSLQIGEKYYFTVKAKNGAGQIGPTATSDGIEFKIGKAAWPKFRGDPRNSGCTTNSGPATATLRWRVQTQGYTESSPAITADGTVCIGSSDGKLYAISPAGVVRWIYQTGSSIDSSPAVGPYGNIYVGSYDGGMYCLNPNGTLRWKFPAGGMIWSSPAVTVDGVVYFGCQDGFLYALNADGTLKWKCFANGSVWSSPAIGPDGGIYFGSGDGRIYAVSPAGAIKWTYLTGSAVDASPAVDITGTIYIGSGDGTLYALNPNGSLKWSYYLGKVADSSPAIGPDGRVYVGAGVVGSSGALHAFDSNGAQLWKLGMSGALRSSPAIDSNGRIYVGSSDARLYAITPDGRVLWRYNATQSILSSPALGADGSVIVGSDDGAVYCLRDSGIIDMTPPTTPIVNIQRQVITPGTALASWWSASDPESGIQGYSYAVGSLPGANDLSGWTDAGVTTSANISSLAWQIGHTYYVSVVARNAAGLTSGVGASPEITVVPAPTDATIGAAKKRQDGSEVRLEAVAVTAVFSDSVFVEDLKRTSAIRCIVQSSSLSPNAVVGVSGTIITRNGERVIINPAFEPQGVAGILKPIGMNCDFPDKLGLDVSAMLMRVTGRVTLTGKDYFVIRDGSFTMSPRGVAGIEVRASYPPELKIGSFVSVTGVPCVEIVNSKMTIVIRAAADPQLVIYPAGQ